MTDREGDLGTAVDFPAPPRPAYIEADTGSVIFAPRAEDAPRIQVKAGEIHTLASHGQRVLLQVGAPFFVRAGQLVRPVVEEVKASDDRTTKVTRFDAGHTGSVARLSIARRSLGTLRQAQQRVGADESAKGSSKHHPGAGWRASIPPPCRSDHYADAAAGWKSASDAWL